MRNDNSPSPVEMPAAPEGCAWRVKVGRDSAVVYLSERSNLVTSENATWPDEVSIVAAAGRILDRIETCEKLSKSLGVWVHQ